MDTDTDRLNRARAAARIRDGLSQLNQAGGDPVVYAELATYRQIAAETATALDHAEQWLRAEHDAGRITTDSGEADDTVPAAIEALTAAKEATQAAATALDAAAGRARYLAPVTPAR